MKETVRARYDQLLRGELYADPLNVFVKIEPHKLKKDQDGAYRLISGVSLVDTMVDRIIFGDLAERVLQTSTQTPSYIGWSPIRGGWRNIIGKFGSKPVVCLDKSSWDWTVVEWMVDAFTQFVLGIAVNPPRWWKEMVRSRMILLYRDAVFRFQDGTELRQGEWGIQKSGSFLTIIFNTVLQYILHVLADPEALDALMALLGDDSVQIKPEDLEDYIKRLEALGPIVKGCKTQHWVEFAGFAFTGLTCVPAYWKKHLFSLRYAENPVETLQSYQLIYAHDPVMFEYLTNELVRYGPQHCVPRQWCLEIMNYK